jgi:hypothetical protein
MKCVACGKEQNKKDLLYSENRELYCINPFTCNEYHPNSVANIVSRGGAVPLYKEDELENTLFDKLNVSNEMKERIMRVATKPQSIRLSKLDIAHYLLELQDKRELNSISEAVRYCVSYTMRNMPIDAADEGLDVPSEDYESSDEVRDPITNPIPIGEEQGIKFVVPDIPKSVNVDWNAVKTDAKKKKIDSPTVKEEEDEFTF